jgi:hypothetical protein
MVNIIVQNGEKTAMNEILYQVVIDPKTNPPLKLRIFENRIEYDDYDWRFNPVVKSLLVRTIANIEKSLFFGQITITTLDGKEHIFGCKNAKAVINEMMKYL